MICLCIQLHTCTRHGGQFALKLFGNDEETQKYECKRRIQIRQHTMFCCLCFFNGSPSHSKSLNVSLRSHRYTRTPHSYSFHFNSCLLCSLCFHFFASLLLCFFASLLLCLDHSFWYFFVLLGVVVVVVIILQCRHCVLVVVVVVVVVFSLQLLTMFFK